jgi:hypothetical protein
VNDSSLSLLMANPQQAHATLTGSAWPWIKSMLFAGHRLTLTVKPQTRSDAQNRLLHSRINDIAKQCEWAGKRWDTEAWKRLLTAAWCRTRNEGVEMVPAIDGKGFDVLYQRTSKLSRAECADLSEFVMAWGCSLPTPVRWSLASLGADAVDPESGEILMREAA